MSKSAFQLDIGETGKLTVPQILEILSLVRAETASDAAMHSVTLHIDEAVATLHELRDMAFDVLIECECDRDESSPNVDRVEEYRTLN